MNDRILRLFSLVCVVATLSACQTLPRHKVHHRVVAAPHTLQAPTTKMVLLPLSIKVKEMSAGGIKDEVGDWSQAAKDHIRATLQSGGPVDGPLELMPLDGLSVEQDAVVEEHLALFNVVAGAALGHTMIQPVDAAWLAKAKRFDYTLGPGLAFLQASTGADRALVIFGEDVVSTAGRKATAVVGALLGVAVPLGHSFLLAGIVDLQRGDILWMDYTFSAGDQTFRDRIDVEELLTELFSNYPGIDSYTQGIKAP